MAAISGAARRASPAIEIGLCTEAEYFAFDEAHSGHWEFRPIPEAICGRPGMGEIRAMGGGRPAHSEVAGNVIASLLNSLRALGNRFCHVYTSDLKVHCGDGLNTYPDVSAVCGKPRYHAGRRVIVDNPILLAEVLSPSTEKFDRGEKWRSYQTIPALRQYLLISTAAPRVDVFTRAESGEWTAEAAEGLSSVLALPALDLQISLADLYDLVELEPDR